MRFELDARRKWAYVLNTIVASRGHEHWGVDASDGSDYIAIALASDAWSGTGRASVETASASDAVTLRSGLRLMTAPAAQGTMRLRPHRKERSRSASDAAAPDAVLSKTHQRSAACGQCLNLQARARSQSSL